MKIKTINKIIAEKIADWLASIKSDEVRNAVKDKVIVTGGCIVSMLQGENVNDFDIYFQDKKAAFEIAKYYAKIANEKYGKSIRVTNEDFDGNPDRVKIRIESAGQIGSVPPSEVEPDQEKEKKEEEELGQYFPIHLSENAITLTSKVQLVTRFYGDPEEIHKNYDFIHCTNYWTAKTKLVTNAPALESILTKELRYVGSLYPLCSIIRTRKFIGRGWRIHAGQYLKMCFQLNCLDLQDIEVLKDQLTGVDSAYFHILTDAVATKKQDDDEFRIEPQYICELVDRIFQ